MTAREFNQCVDQFSDNLFRFIVKNMRHEEHARDVVQESFTRLWDHHHNVNFSKAKSYLFTTGYHCMIDTLRKEKRHDGEFNENEGDYSHEEHYSDLSEVLEEACSRLPEIQRSVIMLRDYEGYAYKEIGDIMELSESQVKVYLFRARKFLKEYLGKRENVI